MSAPNPIARWTDEQMLAFDPFQDCDRDVEIRNREVKIVTVKKPHKCAVGDHYIEIGSRARYERAFVDGKPGQWYACPDCLEAAWAINVGAIR